MGNVVIVLDLNVFKETTHPTPACGAASVFISYSVADSRSLELIMCSQFQFLIGPIVIGKKITSD